MLDDPARGTRARGWKQIVRRSTMSEPDTTPGSSATREEPKPMGELETLKTQLRSAEQARDEYLGQAKRARADFENYQKRAAREQAQDKKFAVAPLASDLLPALDNLER